MLKKIEIKTQIDPTHAAKLTYIQQQTRQDMAEILGQAIDLYYEQLKPANAPQAFQEAGLVGFINVDLNTTQLFENFIL